MAVKNYLCKKCATLVQKDSRPSSFDCPSGGHHEWTDLGEIGDDTYQCKKCSKTIKSKSRPTSFDCPSGGQHQWNKL